VGWRLVPEIPQSMCFGCSPRNHAGLGRHTVYRLQDDGAVRADYVPPEHHGGGGRVVHGGVLTALLDEAAGFLVATLTDQGFFTVGMQVAFRGPATIGEPVTAVARLAERRRRSLAVHVEARAGTMLAARGEVGYFTVPPERYVEMTGFPDVPSAFLRMVPDDEGSGL